MLSWLPCKQTQWQEEIKERGSTHPLSLSPCLSDSFCLFFSCTSPLTWRFIFLSQGESLRWRPAIGAPESAFQFLSSFHSWLLPAEHLSQLLTLPPTSFLKMNCKGSKKKKKKGKKRQSIKGRMWRKKIHMYAESLSVCHLEKHNQYLCLLD